MTQSKRASGLQFIQHELSEARLLCDQLKSIVNFALEIVHSSSHRDAIYAVAGDIIKSVPQMIHDIDNSLSAAATAANKMDNEELQFQIRPEKLDVLNQILDDVRMKFPQ